MAPTDAKPEVMGASTDTNKKSWSSYIGDATPEGIATAEKGSDYSTFNPPGTAGTAPVKNTKRTMKQKFLLIWFSMGSLLSGSCLAMMIPFFPLEAQRRAISQTLTSGIFSVFSLTQLMAYPVIGRLLPRIGVKTLYCVGMAVTAVANISFGMLFRIESPTAFIILCYTVRIIEGMGTAAVITTALTIAANQFSGSTSTAVAVMETMNSIGLSLGAAIGAGLFSIGGFSLPFYSQGCFILALVLLSVLFLPKVEVEAEPRSGSGRKILWVFLSAWENWLCCTAAFTVATVWTAIDSSIARYASDALGTTASQIGLYFLVATGSYAIASIVWGRLADRLTNTYALIGPCFFMTALGIALVPPLPWTGLQPSWWLLGVGLTVKEIFQGGAYVPVLNRMLSVTISRGLPDDVVTQAFTCSMFGTAAAVGNVVGPVSCGLIIDATSFSFMIGCLVALTSTVGALAVLQAVKLHWSRAQPDPSGYAALVDE